MPCCGDRLQTGAALQRRCSGRPPVRPPHRAHRPPTTADPRVRPAQRKPTTMSTICDRNASSSVPFVGRNPLRSCRTFPNSRFHYLPPRLQSNHSCWMAGELRSLLCPGDAQEKGLRTGDQRDRQPGQHVHLPLTRHHHDRGGKRSAVVGNIRAGNPAGSAAQWPCGIRGMRRRGPRDLTETTDPRSSGIVQNPSITTCSTAGLWKAPNTVLRAAPATLLPEHDTTHRTEQHPQHAGGRLRDRDDQDIAHGIHGKRQFDRLKTDGRKSLHG